MPATASLTFDPRYVEFVIQTWEKQGLKPVQPTEFTNAVAMNAEATFRSLNEKGLLEENVSSAEINRALTLLKKLKLTKQGKVGPKGAQVDMLSLTPAGRTTLLEEALGGIRPEFAETLVAQNAALRDLLHDLNEAGPLALPMSRPLPTVPTKGKQYEELLKEGLLEFLRDNLHESDENIDFVFQHGTGTKKPTSSQLVSNAVNLVLQKHPARKIADLDKLIPIAEKLGLIWVGIQQVNFVVAVKSIGSAASEVGGLLKPNTPTWEQIGPRFLDALAIANHKLADGSGFISIEALRGELGNALRISSPVVDALLSQARDVTDREYSDIRLHFEENEELMYRKGRQPFLWHQYAYDLVAITLNANTTNAYRKIAAATEK